MSQLAVLRELGIEVYRVRIPGRPVSTTTPSILPPVSTAKAAQVVGVAAETAPGRATVSFSSSSGWTGLRLHLLRAAAANEVGNEADIVFGGRGKLLGLPSLGALASNPALKRQAWHALRALRRSPR